MDFGDKLGFLNKNGQEIWWNYWRIPYPDDTSNQVLSQNLMKTASKVYRLVCSVCIQIRVFEMSKFSTTLFNGFSKPESYILRMFDFKAYHILSNLPNFIPSIVGLDSVNVVVFSFSLGFWVICWVWVELRLGLSRPYRKFPLGPQFVFSSALCFPAKKVNTANIVLA